MRIAEIKARQVFDSRGIPTIEADVFLDGGAMGRFITPSGASVGKHEALELRDKDPARYGGRGVSLALNNVCTIIRDALKGRSFMNQAELDMRLLDLDGTDNKSKLGANALLAVSGAFFHAHAHHEQRPLYHDPQNPHYLLPLPLVNVINGGAHANNGLDIQEFMLVPSGAKRFSEAMRMVAETFYVLKTLLQQQGLSTAVGDEGGFAPKLGRNEDALDLLMSAVEKAGFRPGHDMQFALDVAGNELYVEKSDAYRLNGTIISRDELLLWYHNLALHYPLCSIEDPFYEDDHSAYDMIMKKMGHLQVVGDDLFVTNVAHIQTGIEKQLANAVLIKMNQIGTITQTLAAVKLTQTSGMRAIISHRSGDSEDTTIADLAIFTGAGQIKTGSLSRSERTAKYNRLLRIEEELGSAAQFLPWCGPPARMT